MLRALILIGFFMFFSCSEKETYEDIPKEISVDLNSVPYGKLSDYNFFKGDLNRLEPNNRLLPYKPASELFTDYALKSRFVWIPKNTQANISSNESIINLPVGSVVIKNFYYTNLLPALHKKIIETRLLINTANGWQPFVYIWNDSQTEAVLSNDGQLVNLQWQKSSIEVLNINYEIPSTQNCFSCHHDTFFSDEILPIGIKPYHLNNNYNYVDGQKNQIQKWREVGFLASTQVPLGEAAVNHNDLNQDLTKRVRSYLDINCGHCHRAGAEAELLPLRFLFPNSQNITALGVCDTRILPAPNPGFSGQHYILPNQPSLSLVYHKMNINTSGLLMPPVGRTVIHQEAIDMMHQWIMTLDDCL
jgi:uncharacterized repeat protein (TIGR03806 family)